MSSGKEAIIFASLLKEFEQQNYEEQCQVCPLNNKTSNNQISEEGALKKNEYCLITGEPLNHTQIKLPCGHVFNYQGLFNEIKEQQYAIGIRNIRYKRITNYKGNYFLCPYCRTLHHGVIPRCLGFDLINRVNKPLKDCLFGKKCPHLFKSGAKKGIMCENPCVLNENSCYTHLSKSKKLKTKN